jgi:hypothetical protein
LKTGDVIQQSEESRNKYAMKLAEAGEIGKAYSRITTPVTDHIQVDQQLFDDIQVKNPPRSTDFNPEDLERMKNFVLPEHVNPILVNPNRVVSLVKKSRSFVKHSVDKWRFEHLRQLVGTQISTQPDADHARFVDLYSRFIQLLIAGKCPPDVLPLFCDTETWAIPKPGTTDVMV